MWITPEQIDDGLAISEAMSRLDPCATDLATLLLLGVGAGEAVPERLRDLVDEDGEDLWRAGVLLPRMAPSAGATIDPRHYAAYCRVNPVLGRKRLLPEVHGTMEGEAQAPASDVGWDAVVVAAHLERHAPRLTKSGELRKDDEARLVSSLGPDEHRWRLALRTAQAAGLVRSAAGRLYGIPESNPRPLTDPAVLLTEGGPRQAGALLNRLVGRRWISLEMLDAVLQARCPTIFSDDRARPWAEREGGWLREAADIFHRVGVFDGIRGADAVVAVRRGTARPPRPPGFMLMPDRDILIAPGELPGPEYGRLCRLAPYVGGDVLHRHRLTREGVAADMACGYDDVLDWLAVRSRTGLPGNVRTSLEAWLRSASRVTLFSGVTVLEHPDGRLERVDSAPPDARQINYDRLPPARFEVNDGHVEVPYGEDALTVRAVIGRIGRKIAADGDAHRWLIAPSGIQEPDSVLDELRRYHEGEIPGELEAAVHAAGGRVRCWTEEAVVLHLPDEAYDALRRDRVIAHHVARELVRGQCIVARAELPTIQARLDDLGYQLELDA